MICPNCEKEIVQTKGKRKKMFCNSTCRSNIWQKAKRKEPKKESNRQKKPVNSEPKSLPEVEIRISRIEELLKLPPKYMPSWKRTPLESELNQLKFKLKND